MASYEERCDELRLDALQARDEARYDGACWRCDDSRGDRLCAQCRDERAADEAATEALADELRDALRQVVSESWSQDGVVGAKTSTELRRLLALIAAKNLRVR